jgi:hypothetical protein
MRAHQVTKEGSSWYSRNTAWYPTASCPSIISWFPGAPGTFRREMRQESRLWELASSVYRVPWMRVRISPHHCLSGGTKNLRPRASFERGGRSGTGKVGPSQPRTPMSRRFQAFTLAISPHRPVHRPMTRGMARWTITITMSGIRNLPGNDIFRGKRAEKKTEMKRDSKFSAFSRDVAQANECGSVGNHDPISNRQQRIERLSSGDSSEPTSCDPTGGPTLPRRQLKYKRAHRSPG